MKFKVGQRQVLIPPGDYRARLIEVKASKFVAGRLGLHLTFEVTDGQLQGEKASAFLNAHYETFSSHSKLYQWFEAAMGHPPDSGEIDLDLLMTRVLVVQIDTKESRKTKNLFSNVVAIKGTYCEL
ncbi:MAG: hypothetical protein A2428_00975 [Bdellovibrionales bacterium RIFOXYC1_FULL_54_43]|nr:MAG: hypothetical protein A2428_00975 [Bdellovibrionales bacterium RIFOXYC1_FULL_54_43]OFZ82857.1 MAG: hypothetical protein A2603_11700 [Bdellovibrionales bacterium RIFOXYD1_FULL_55_31]